MKTLINLLGNFRRYAAVLALGALPIVAEPFGSDVQLCPDDRPCFNGSYQAGNRVVFRFNGIKGWDFYNVRYNTKGGGVKQVENRSGTYSFTNVLPHRIYTLSVQGCNSRFLGRSRCSEWVSESVTTR